MKSYKILLSILMCIISINLNAQDANHFAYSKTITFPNGGQGMVSYITFPDNPKWGFIDVSITGGFGFELTRGVLSKRFNIVDNGSNQFTSVSTEVLSASGELANQWNIGDYDNVTRRIPIYHLANSGNDLNIRIEGQLTHSVSISGISAAITISSPAVVTNSKMRQYKSIMEDRLGIGTLNPTERLSVNGNIRAQEIKVEASNWPDYVFHDDYPLLGLGEIEKFIKINKHLPEVPSEETIKVTGLKVGEMNAILLKKIEELTLILIDKEKQINKQQRDINQIKLQINKVLEIRSVK